MRAQVADIVRELVLDRGYEQTSIEDICAAADVSRSTFFRYFPSKDDALLAGMTDAGERLLAALEERPDGEHIWVAMRRALDPLIVQYEADDETTRQLTRLIISTPPLAIRHREKSARWHQLLRPEIARRLNLDPSDDYDPLPDAIIAAALGCIEATLIAWTRSPEPRAITAILDRAMGAIPPLKP